MESILFGIGCYAAGFLLGRFVYRALAAREEARMRATFSRALKEAEDLLKEARAAAEGPRTRPAGSPYREPPPAPAEPEAPSVVRPVVHSSGGLVGEQNGHVVRVDFCDIAGLTNPAAVEKLASLGVVQLRITPLDQAEARMYRPRPPPLPTHEPLAIRKV